MNLTKNHLLNILFWLIVIGFMVVQSIDHTINDHYKGVMAAIRDYKFQSQTRNNYLINVAFKSGHFNQIESKIYATSYELKVTLDPIDFILKSIELTDLIDQNPGQLNIDNDERQNINALQVNLKQERLILISHAKAFNALIAKFPYKYRANQYKPFQIPFDNTVSGVIVER